MYKLDNVNKINGQTDKIISILIKTSDEIILNDVDNINNNNNKIFPLSLNNFKTQKERESACVKVLKHQIHAFLLLKFCFFKLKTFYRRFFYYQNKIDTIHH